MKHKKEIYEKMKRRDFGESMSDETKLKVLNFVERQLRLYSVVGRSEQLVCDCPDENWVYDDSGVDMYCKKCHENETN